VNELSPPFSYLDPKPQSLTPFGSFIRFTRWPGAPRLTLFACLLFACSVFGSSGFILEYFIYLHEGFTDAVVYPGNLNGVG
jgi:hypothetical protein